MLKHKGIPVVAAGALIGMFGFAGQIASAGDANCSDRDLDLVKAFVDQADITLAEAIETAEHKCNGKAIHATLGCEQEFGNRGFKTDNYQVCCLAEGAIVEVCVDRQSGAVLVSRESSALPQGVQLVSLKDSSPGTAHSQQSFRIKKASDLIGMSVQNPQGADLGDVQDLAIDAENGRVAYAVLSFGGFLGMGDKWFAIPTGALTLPGDGKHFVLDVDKNRLKSAPGFAKDKWPVMGNPAWGEEVHKFYGQQPYWMTEGEGSTPTDDQRIQKASEIMGRSVSNNRGETLGEIKDLVIDPDQYRVVYVVLKFGGFLGFGEKLFAIPTGVLQMPSSDGHAVLTVDKDRLTEAKGFDKDNWPNLADPTVSSGIFAFYGQKSYGAEDLHGGQYVTAKAGLTCHQCGRTMGARAFSRDGNMYCCAGCANGTGCTCGKVQNKPGS